ncbi:MAG: sulfotransferase [Candidatus Omnitrophica bacterium]|nr:sulfotransferase [Candidatus Omnitrophota bacterium]
MTSELTAYVHVGFPKTATSALQQSIFTCHPQILYLGQPFNSDELRKLFEVDILLKDEIEYDAAVCRDQIETYISKHKNDQHRALLLSRESMCYTMLGGHDRCEIARRIKGLFGEVKILIVIRNQFDFISSMYSEEVSGGLYISFKRYLKNWWNLYDISFFPQLKYYELIKRYQELFGDKNVKILCFEDFVADQKTYLEKIYQFMGVDTLGARVPKKNVSLSRAALFCNRLANRLITYDVGRPFYMEPTRGLGERPNKSLKNFRYIYKVGLNMALTNFDRLLGLKSYKSLYPEQWKAKLHNLYAPSNQKLQKLCGFDLQKYRYPL